jgi:uncharacterized membrane protein (DUF4010 family)
MDELELFRRLGLALAIGMLLGLERGWQGRLAPPGTRVAGIRTFSLMGLLGGLWGLLGLEAGELAMAIGFAAFSALIIAAHVMRVKGNPAEQGITTEIAGLLTFCLGALAARGHMTTAAAGGVVALTLLSFKESLHQFIARLAAAELQAVVKLLLISVVMLPVLPNQGYGPGEAINPYRLWWVVVMIAAISFIGYVAIKVAGPRIGILLTGFFGGLASSTALTLSFARMGRASPDLQNMLAAGVSVAAGTMFLRILLIVVVLSPRMTATLAVPMGIMAAVSYFGALALWLDRRGEGLTSPTPVSNPFELGTAIKFGLFLAVILVAAKFLQQAYGQTGIYALSAISGLADVDAISVSMARMANDGMALKVAAAGVVIAAFVNTVVKAGMVLMLCGGAMAWRVGTVFALTIAAGGATLAFG